MPVFLGVYPLVPRAQLGRLSELDVEDVYVPLIFGLLEVGHLLCRRHGLPPSCRSGLCLMF
jgi:hypothetical protein